LTHLQDPIQRHTLICTGQADFSSQLNGFKASKGLVRATVAEGEKTRKRHCSDMATVRMIHESNFISTQSWKDRVLRFVEINSKSFLDVHQAPIVQGAATTGLEDKKGL
jgi:hypothetical protein